MAIMQRACEALDRQGIPRADTGTHGYHVDKWPEDFSRRSLGPREAVTEHPRHAQP